MAQQKVTISVPTHLNSEERELVADQVLRRIRERSAEGLNIQNRPWSGKAGKYSDSYKKSLDYKNAGKSGRVDLRLSGDMLAAMDLLSHRSGKITIGFKAGSEENARAEGNILGTYGQEKPIPGKARDFLGISKSDLNKIVKDFPEEKTEESRAAELSLSEVLGASRALSAYTPSNFTNVATRIRRG